MNRLGLAAIGAAVGIAGLALDVSSSLSAEYGGPSGKASAPTTHLAGIALGMGGLGLILGAIFSPRASS